MYAGKNGDVYRKDSSGGWQKYENGGWSDTAPKPTPHTQNAALTQGTQAWQRDAQLVGNRPVAAQQPATSSEQFDSWIETLRHAKQERSGHGSINLAEQVGSRAEVARKVLEEQRAVGLSDRVS
jgi:hypothetical protein